MKELLSAISKNWVGFVISFVGVILALVAIGLLKRVIVWVKSHNTPNKEKNKLGSVSKLAMICLFVIMTIIVIVSFFASEPRFSISNGVIYLIGLMIFVLFFESIESFSVADFITLKKEIKDKKEEVNKLSSENSELRTQLTSIVTASINNQNQNQNHFVFGDSFLRNTHVEPAEKTEVSNSEESEVSTETDVSNKGAEAANKPSSGWLRSRFFRRANQIVINKYAELKEIPVETIQQNVRFANWMDERDHIMEHRAIFDAYIRRPLEEVFIETTNITSGVGASVNVYYRWYYMISLILQYARINKKSAKLVILIPKLPTSIQAKLGLEGLDRYVERGLERIRYSFQPAIQNGFLEVVTIDLLVDECNAILESLTSDTAA